MLSKHFWSMIRFCFVDIFSLLAQINCLIFLPKINFSILYPRWFSDIILSKLQTVRFIGSCEHIAILFILRYCWASNYGVYLCSEWHFMLNGSLCYLAKPEFICLFSLCWFGFFLFDVGWPWSRKDRMGCKVIEH